MAGMIKYLQSFRFKGLTVILGVFSGNQCGALDRAFRNSVSGRDQEECISGQGYGCN